MVKVDKFGTSILNGYTEGQAQSLEMWSEEEFMIFMGEVIRFDGKPVVIKYEDGSIKPFVEKEPEKKIAWQKSKFGNNKEWCRAKDNPKLASDLRRNGGKAIMAGYSYSLNGDYINKSLSNI